MTRPMRAPHLPFHRSFWFLGIKLSRPNPVLQERLSFFITTLVGSLQPARVLRLVVHRVPYSARITAQNATRH